MTSQVYSADVDALPNPAEERENWHLITCEYPPQLGGVSDYTQLVAQGLAQCGDQVHVWRPKAGTAPEVAGVAVDDTLGHSGIADLWRLGKRLNAFRGPRRLLVQWVPHGYGFLSMNLPFCLWIWARAAWRRDRVEIMVHEPYLSFGEGSWRQNLVALVHRVMVSILLRAASKVWVSIPAWEGRLRPYLVGRRAPFEWLPVPSNVPVCPDAAAVTRLREQHLKGRRFLVGHFGTHGSSVTQLLEKILPRLLDRCPQAVVALIGKGSEDFRRKLLSGAPQLSDRVHAAGILDSNRLSQWLAACDLVIQPYLDGINTRRGSAMAALAHGVPMVTTRGRHTEDLWSESDAIVAAPAGDEEAFVTAAERLLNDDRERARLSAKARALYAERFDIQHVIHALRRTAAAN